MKVLVAVDSVSTLEILIDDMIARSWPAGTEAQVLSVVDDGDVPLKVWREEGYVEDSARRARSWQKPRRQSHVDAESRIERRVVYR